MAESRQRGIFRPLLWCAAGAVAALAGFVPVAVFGSAFAELLYVYLIMPSLVGLALLIGLALVKRHAVPIVAATVVFGAATWLLFHYTDAIQNTSRWRIYGHAYEQRVLAAPQTAGQLKHVVWKSWGVADSKTVVYLVYDPSNSLAEAARTHAAGKFAGIPCPVPQVSRLASEWYAVEFYKEQNWNDCGGKTDRDPRTP